jgi:uncharacterized NAD-dependent epimerase/dehydratase family protein
MKDDLIAGPAVVLTHGLLDTVFAKTCHGLLRGTERFDILGVVDYKFSGKDAGVVMDGINRNTPVFKDLQQALDRTDLHPKYALVGVATPGGYLPGRIRIDIVKALETGLSVISGLHMFLCDDVELATIAAQNGAEIIDIRKPPPRDKLRFWTGAVMEVKSPKIAVLGMDCAIGKRTTCRLITEMCIQNGLKAVMIYTGQTGWMQGYKYGFIFDTIVNDFITGEIERVLLECYHNENPDLILIEGQSSLRNPSGPCGSEFILSGRARGVILQHAPTRKFFEDTSIPIPGLESEIDLIRDLGAEVLGVTINESGIDIKSLKKECRNLEFALDIPVEKLWPVIENFLKQSQLP